ncbi:MAG TPA: dTDP-4-dehydrorhamnose reductase [Burkholderiales bacterium]|nr:dTDP-4-dehydrorhamnose reductase [Burkholderiales bacterium]
MIVLLTGRDGQVGTCLAPLLASFGEVHATDRRALDLEDAGALRRAVRELRPGLIVNAAAYTAVDRAETDRERAMRVNARAPAILAEEARRLGALLVHFSTDYVFDGEKAEPYVEDDTAHPLNVYGASKLEGERGILATQCRHLILRTSWVYGTGGRNFVRAILDRARAGEALRVVDDQVGAPTSAAALAQACAEAIRAGAEGLYHASCGGRTTWHGFAAFILRATRLDASLVAVSSAQYGAKAKRPRNSLLDNGKLWRSLAIALPAWDVEAGRVLGMS